MRPGEKASADALHRLPRHIQLVDRCQIRARTLVRPAPLQNPDVLSIRIRLDSGHHTHGSPARKLAPVVDYLIGFLGDGLGCRLTYQGSPRAPRMQPQDQSAV